MDDLVGPVPEAAHGPKGKGSPGNPGGRPAAGSPGPGVTIRGLSVRAGGREILCRVDADLPAGETTLIVGPSGAGKSVLLRILAGLISPGAPGLEVEGSVRIGERELLVPGAGGPGGPSPAGIVFQSFALFDELSVEENILFGFDHRRRRPGGARGASPAGDRASDRRPVDRRDVARGLMAELGIPGGSQVDVLSGGQKQRLAIARAIAFDPELIAYDEPTSGLDPHNAARVVELVRDTGAAHRKTTVVVTHAPRHFASIAARIYLLQDGRLRAISLDELDRWESRGAGDPGDPFMSGERIPTGRLLLEPLPAPSGAAGRALGLFLGFFAATGSAVEGLLRSLVSLAPVWRSARWGLRYLLHYLMLVASPSAWLYFGAAGVIAGFVATYFTFKFLPFRAYTEPLLTEELLHGLGFALYRIVVPVLITILLAARCGAAVASDVGARRYAQGTEAMQSMGARPARYLLTGILHAFILGTPLLIALSFIAARLTSLLVFAYNHPLEDPFFWDGHFHRNLRVPGGLLYRGTGFLLLKVLLSGLGVGAIAYHRGMRPKRSAVEVSAGITSTIIWSTLLVLVIHFAFAFFEFEEV